MARLPFGRGHVDPPCQAKVENLDVPVFRDEEVLGLQVAVHDPLLVGGGKTPGDLQGVVHRLLTWDGPRDELAA